MAQDEDTGTSEEEANVSVRVGNRWTSTNTNANSASDLQSSSHGERSSHLLSTAIVTADKRKGKFEARRFPPWNTKY
jgi:hypothetical protein